MFGGFVRFFVIEALDSFRHGVRDHRDGMVADHGAGLVAPELPDGQASALLVHSNERVDEVDSAFLIDDRIERVRGAKRVPKRENRVLVGAAYGGRWFNTGVVWRCW